MKTIYKMIDLFFNMHNSLLSCIKIIDRVNLYDQKWNYGQQITYSICMKLADLVYSTTCICPDIDASSFLYQHITDVMHPCDMDIRTHVSVNSARWMPGSGEGIVYGTNRGDLHVCRPG